MGYWCAASLVAWGLVSLLGLFWHPLGPASASTIVLAAGLGCAANWLKNRTFHCGITAPVLLIGGSAFLLWDIRVLRVPPGWVWLFVCAGTGIAFVLEWKYAHGDAGSRA
jgi:hypothetical protein